MKAVKAKERYIKACAAADLMKRNISEDMAWRWACHQATTASFDKAINAVVSLEDEFAKTWHNFDLADVKRSTRSLGSWGDFAARTRQRSTGR